MIAGDVRAAMAGANGTFLVKVVIEPTAAVGSLQKRDKDVLVGVHGVQVVGDQVLIYLEEDGS